MPEFILGAEIQKDLCLADPNFGGPAANIPMQISTTARSISTRIFTGCPPLLCSLLTSHHSRAPQPDPDWLLPPCRHGPKLLLLVTDLTSLLHRAVVASDSLLFLTSKDLHTTSTPACRDPLQCACAAPQLLEQRQHCSRQAGSKGHSIR